MRELRLSLSDYLAVRRALGFKLEREGRMLADFVAFADAAGATSVTVEVALAWASSPAGASAVWWSQRLSMVRGFARHLQSVDPDTEVPPVDLLAARYTRRAPYVYSDSDISALLAAAGVLRDPLRAATFQAFLGLLACAGLRGSEAMALDDGDLDWDQGVMTIRNAKLGKSREIPLHPSVLEALQEYTVRRDRLCPASRSPALLVLARGVRLTHGMIQPTFRDLRRQAGLERPSAPRWPRVHDLRHTFAVKTVIGWYRDGHDIQARLPLLATYLGHVDPANTYWYLSAVPELLALAAGRLESPIERRP